MCSTEELYVIFLEAMLAIDAHDNLTHSRRHLEVFIDASKPHVPPSPVHLGEPIAWSINNHSLVVFETVEMHESGSSCLFSNSSQLVLKHMVDERRLAHIGPPYEKYFFLLVKYHLVVSYLFFEHINDIVMVCLSKIDSADGEFPSVK